MILAFVSFVVSLACLVVFLSRRNKTKKPPRDKMTQTTAVSVRISYLLCLCAVPFLAFISTLLNSVTWAYYAESAAIVEGFATLLIGLMALLQRYGALYFKMPPAMERNEILALIFLPVALYLSYLPAENIMGYYLGPGIYSLYLLYIFSCKSKNNSPGIK